MQRCVGGILFQQGRILLGRRRAGRAYGGLWDVLGGHCEAGESDEQTLARELFEEAGGIPLVYRSLGIFEEPATTPDYRLHLFVVHRWQGNPSNRSAEHTEIGWHELGTAYGLDLASPRYVEIFRSLVPG